MFALLRAHPSRSIRHVVVAATVVVLAVLQSAQADSGAISPAGIQ